MQKKSLAISNIVMLLATFVCVAVFCVASVWAYNANLAMKLPAEFNFSNLTLKLGNNAIYTNGTMNNQNFTITPVAANTLEISATYQNFGGVKTVTFTTTQGYTLSLKEAVAYGVDLGVGTINSHATGVFANSTLTITLASSVTPASADIITFQILFS